MAKKIDTNEHIALLSRAVLELQNELAEKTKLHDALYGSCKQQTKYLNEIATEVGKPAHHHSGLAEMVRHIVKKTEWEWPNQ